MVVGDRHYKHTDEGPVKSVRRNRSPPRNTEDSTAPGTNDNPPDDCAVREGPEYQATIPECHSSNQSLKVLSDSSYATMLWTPQPKTLDAKVDTYVCIAREKHGYDEEQALGLLFWHNHNIDRASSDLLNFTPVPNDWTLEDMVLFEQAFHFHGKNFHRVHHMLPDKSIGNLVKYYYLWKKIQYRVSLLDKRAQGTRGPYRNGSDAIEDSDSDFESAKGPLKEETANVEPASTTSQSKAETHGRLRNKHKPPSGIYVNYEDLEVLCAKPLGSNHTDVLKPFEIEFDSLKRRVIANKQELASYKQRSSPSSIDALRPAQVEIFIDQKWTHSELLLAVQGIRRYGQNFSAIAEVLCTKTEHQVQNFFYSYRVQYNLDGVLREFEAERENETGGIVEESPTDMYMDGLTSERANPTSSPPPPPLMKQFSNERSVHHQPDSVHKPPVLHQAVKSSSSLSSRMILHQPPPLFKHGTTSVLCSTHRVATTK